MSDNRFFKPTILYKEYMILDMIEKNHNITQREIGKTIGIAVSMVNDYINEYEKKGLLKRQKINSKTVEYYITKKGLERRRLLNLEFLSSSQKLYNVAKLNIEQYLINVYHKGYRNILLYGAGEVAELFLQSLKGMNMLDFEVKAVIDDDLRKHEKFLIDTCIVSLDKGLLMDYDGILISSYNNREIMKEKLLHRNISSPKLINFFDN